MKRLGLALGSGGFRGMAHIGVIKVLEKNNIPIRYVSGSSIGSVIGMLHVLGYTGGNMEKLALDFINNPPFRLVLDPLQFFCSILKIFLRRTGLISDSPLGIISGKRVCNYLYEFVGEKRFNELAKPLVITATDLKTGEAVAFVPDGFVLTQHSLGDTVCFYNRRIIDALRASISIPGIFEPFNYEGRKLIDGGVKNSVPVDLLSCYRPGVNLAVDLGFDYQCDESINDPLAVAVQSLDIMGTEIARLNQERYADLTLFPQVGGVEKERPDTARRGIQEGEKVAREKLARLKKYLSFI